MRVCLINTNREWGGGEKWHHLTALELVNRGHRVTIIAYPGSPLAIASKDFVKVLEFKIGKLSFLNPLIYIKIKNFFISEQYDAVIMNLPSDVKAFSKPAAKAGIKKTIYRRGMNHPIKASLVNRYFYANFVTDIIANSHDVKRSVFKFIPELEQKITVIPNGVDLSQLIEKSSPRKEKLLIGNLGRLVEQKGQSDLIKLGSLLKLEKKKFHIYIAGEGPMRADIENQMKLSNLEDHITLLGKTNPAEFFSLIDYFVFPSRFEGLSNAMLEALQWGKPIFCYDLASNSEIVKDGMNGYLVKPFDIETLKMRLIELSETPEKYKLMQKKGQEILEAKFDSKKLFDQLEELMKP
ncbi:MAG: glycosyltransferase involved in cell wall biosynthesis [Flammeovirgaceae bacterium]